MTDQAPSPESAPERVSPAPSVEATPIVEPVPSVLPLEPPTAQEVREGIESAALEAQEVAIATAKVNLQFPVVGFINPVEELEKMRRLCDSMPEQERKGYPDVIRSRLIAHHADKTQPEVSDEELALAIFIKRTTDSPLTPEDLETKATGKAPRKAKEPKAGKEPKKGLDDILGGLL